MKTTSNVSKYVIIDDQKVELNKVRIYNCDSWEDFTREVKKIRCIEIPGKPGECSKGTIYRGHANTEWKLSSKLERSFEAPLGWKEINGNRPNFKKTANDVYNRRAKEILTKFISLVEGNEEIDLSKSEDEIWALSRHYGLITPFLDWTVSPYIAVFFAFIEQYNLFEFHFVPKSVSPFEGQVNVWGITCWDGLETKHEFEIVKFPRKFGTRLWAQAGLFTKLYSTEYNDIQSYLESKGLAHYLECYVLPCRCAAEALNDLRLMNITYSKLFPDLYGAAMEANVSEFYLRFVQVHQEILKKSKSKKGS